VKTNTPAVVLGVTTGVFVIMTVYFYMGKHKLDVAIADAKMKIDSSGKLVVDTAA